MMKRTLRRIISYPLLVIMFVNLILGIEYGMSVCRLILIFVPAVIVLVVSVYDLKKLSKLKKGE